jgi:predicted Fe-Mo cluster-binding NifX family protein
MDTMKIAIPLFNTRISPRFDCATKFLLALFGSDLVDKQVVQTGTLSSLEKINKLKELNINILICGGIDRASMQLLNSFEGLMIYSWVTGEAEDALNCFLKGKLESCLMIGEGGIISGRWKFKSGHQRRRGRGNGQKTKTGQKRRWPKAS